MRRKVWKTSWLMVCMMFLLMMVGTALSFAQQFPNKPINLVVAVGTGGTADITARMLADSVSKMLGQQVIVSNNGGGGGSVALTFLKNEKPDGYHIAWAANQPLTCIPHQRQVPYTLNDFVPIIEVSTSGAGVVVSAESPWKTFKELIDYAKKNPTKVSYTVTGT